MELQWCRPLSPSSSFVTWVVANYRIPLRLLFCPRPGRYRGDFNLHDCPGPSYLSGEIGGDGSSPRIAVGQARAMATLSWPITLYVTLPRFEESLTVRGAS